MPHDCARDSGAPAANSTARLNAQPPCAQRRAGQVEAANATPHTGVMRGGACKKDIFQRVSVGPEVRGEQNESLPEWRPRSAGKSSVPERARLFEHWAKFCTTSAESAESTPVMPGSKYTSHTRAGAPCKGGYVCTRGQEETCLRHRPPHRAGGAWTLAERCVRMLRCERRSCSSSFCSIACTSSSSNAAPVFYCSTKGVRISSAQPRMGEDLRSP